MTPIDGGADEVVVLGDGRVHPIAPFYPACPGIRRHLSALHQHTNNVVDTFIFDDCWAPRVATTAVLAAVATSADDVVEVNEILAHGLRLLAFAFTLGCLPEADHLQLGGEGTPRHVPPAQQLVGARRWWGSPIK